MRKRKYIRYALVFAMPLVFILSQCVNKAQTVDPRGEDYAGSAACIKCHSSVFHNYLHSAHYLTSRPANAKSIIGSLQTDSATVPYNTHQKVTTERNGDSLFQVLYTDGKRMTRKPLDMIFGANRGETFLYWDGAEVKQLPVSYYISLHQWANSPGGYYRDSVNFSRVIHERCFECHSSYIKNANEASGNSQSDSLDRSSLILGIDCERCHGPGRQHADFQEQNPGIKQPRFITRFATLTRQRRIDFCSQCHSGNTSVMTKSTFGFKPGDTLGNYTSGQNFHAYRDAATIDVHGNQVKLLTASKCFISSNMECATCHSMHADRVKSVATYSTYCLTCHSETNHNFCKLAVQIGPAIKNNCIDCHMPMQTSKSVVIAGSGKTSAPIFVARTHLIAIYQR